MCPAGCELYNCNFKMKTTSPPPAQTMVFTGWASHSGISTCHLFYQWVFQENKMSSVSWTIFKFLKMPAVDFTLELVGAFASWGFTRWILVANGPSCALPLAPGDCSCHWSIEGVNHSRRVNCKYGHSMTLKGLRGFSGCQSPCLATCRYCIPASRWFVNAATVHWQGNFLQMCGRC